jgi:16S rRNA (uracil1498-N3)-methyltransferase
MRRRFFVDRFEEHAATLTGEAAHHLGRVLRAAAGQVYELSDGQTLWLARVEEVSPDAVKFALVEQLPVWGPRVHLTLLLAIVKFDRFEWALEKATESGVARIIPLAAARSEKGLLAAAPKRSERWQKIIVEASEQSRRLRPPTLEPLARPVDAFRGRLRGLRILLSERPSAPPLKQVLAGKKEGAATLAIGPEGGWVEAEYASAAERGFVEASLGRLILRTETAVVAGLAAVNFALAD